MIRGHWILANLVGAPPPPPPPNVPALDDNTVSAALPIRERLAAQPIPLRLSQPWTRSGCWRTSAVGAPLRGRTTVDASGGSRQRTFTRWPRSSRLLQRRAVCRDVDAPQAFALGRGVALTPRHPPNLRTRKPLSLLVPDSWHRQQYPVPNEEIPMIITKKALPRRTFLRGMGASLALPLLDAMIPAATAMTATPAKPVRRLGFVFMPMGCDITRWTPAAAGTLGSSPILSSSPVRARRRRRNLITAPTRRRRTPPFSAPPRRHRSTTTSGTTVDPSPRQMAGQLRRRALDGHAQTAAKVTTATPPK